MPARSTKPVAKNVQAADQSATPLYTVVYIHGIGNKPAPAILKRQWDQALFGIDMGERTRMAYWADIRYAQPLASTASSERSLSISEAYCPISAEQFIEQSCIAVPYGKDAQAFARSLAEKMLDYADNAARVKSVTKEFGSINRPATDRSHDKSGQTGSSTSKRGSHVESVEAKALPLPGWARKWATEWITKTFIQDVSAYFYDRKQHDAMQDRLRKILVPENGLYLIVAHSLGSVISYDVLRDLDPSWKSGNKIQLMTFGSPLGIEEVEDQLAKPLNVPTLIEKWYNFADPLDPVALDKTLADEYSPSVKIADIAVINRDTLRIHGFNPHSATGYLETNEAQRAAREILGSSFTQPVPKFTIARDLAAQMSSPSERLAVLIELDGDIAGETLADKRKTLVKELRQLTKHNHEACIDELKRYVAASLTSDEIDNLMVHHQDLSIATIWKNSVKSALLNVSSQTVQAYTAQRGYGAKGQGITWAILDTGVNGKHPHFEKHTNIEVQWDCTHVGKPVRHDGTENTDGNGHGTHVAGIIAGEEKEDQLGFNGIAPQAKLRIYKVLSDEGDGNDSWIIKALDHIAEANDASPKLVIHGVNLSLGGPFDPTVYGCGHSPICRELRRLWRQGVIVCIAAGNEGRVIVETTEGEQDLNLDLSVGDPANLDEAIAVGSVHKEQPHIYGISYFSSRGPTADGRAKPDLVAPGERIISCNARFDEPPHEQYVQMSGTSMACPHVSGIAASFLSVRREFIGFPDKVKEILLDHCTDLRRDHYHQGAGLPNLTRMLTET